MGHKTKRDNFRVEVYPKYPGDFGGIFISGIKRTENESLQLCTEMVAQIIRHVNEVGNASVRFDTNKVCEHCGRVWTEDSQDYNGGCCDQDQEAEESRELAAKGGV